MWEPPPPLLLLLLAFLLARRVAGEEDTQDSCMSDEQEEEEDPEIDLDDVMQIMMDSTYEILHLFLGVIGMDLTTKYLIFLAEPLP